MCPHTVGTAPPPPGAGPAGSCSLPSRSVEESTTASETGQDTGTSHLVLQRKKSGYNTAPKIGHKPGSDAALFQITPREKYGPYLGTCSEV